MTEQELAAIEARVTAIRTALSVEVDEAVSASARDVPALIAEVRKLTAERDALLLRCKEAEAGWLLAATQRDDFAVSLVMARDGGK